MNITAITGHEAQRRRLEMMASGGRLPPTMLFSGISGIGKRKLAKLVLASLFCAGENRPCGKCSECIRSLPAVSGFC
jgi:DNA polymerase-3 subunit delta'